MIQQQSIPIILDKDENPLAFIYYSKNRERVIYLIRKPSEEELVELLESLKNEKA